VDHPPVIECSTGPCAVEVVPGDRSDHLVLAVRGVLSSRSDDEPIGRMLATQLLDRGRVVVDLSRAGVGWGPVARLFPTALAEAGGWPLARLALARADPLTTRILRGSRVHLTVPLASTLDGAALLLDVRPPRVARDQPLPCHEMAPALARLAVASACDDWELDDALHDAAATVVTELVRNAVEHARTACALHLTLDPRHLQVAVRDSRPVAEGCPRIAVAGDRGDRGYGLLMVQGLSRGWGVTPYSDGKTVWALLDAERDPLF
jgi:anti-sigma regulatory factor (Ser/Thr protein kinase)